MIAFVQGYGLNDSGGGARILTRLAEGAPFPVLSVATGTAAPRAGGAVEEIHLSFRPPSRVLARVEASRFGRHLARADRLLGFDFMQRLSELCAARGVRAIHGVPHGPDFWYAFLVAQQRGLPFFVSLHDELAYNMPGNPRLPEVMEQLGRVWREAHGRFVISEPMGAEYARRYGARPYSLVTDGLDTIPDAPLARSPARLTLYFMGLVHLSYRANFEAVARGLDRFQAAHPGVAVRFVIRGGLPFPLPDGASTREVRPWGTPDEVQRDLDDADVLYLPLPFEPQYEGFWRYSLSTKMVTYLGSGLPILYHGPAEAAAAGVLGGGAAGLAETLDPDAIADALARTVAGRDALVRSALDLGRRAFTMGLQRERFWTPIRAAVEASGAPAPPAEPGTRRAYGSYGVGERLWQQAARRGRLTWGQRVASAARAARWRAMGMDVGAGTTLPPIDVTWPHQVRLGRDCTIEPGVAFKFDGYWQPGPSIVVGDRVFVGRGCEFNVSHGLTIGDDALIASGCRFIDHNHGSAPGLPMREQPVESAPIAVEADAWLGVNVTVLKGVRIGRGAIVGAGSVVTRSVPDGEVWAGVPARRVRARAAGDTPETAGPAEPPRGTAAPEA